MVDGEVRPVVLRTRIKIDLETLVNNIEGWVSSEDYDAMWLVLNCPGGNPSANPKDVRLLIGELDKRGIKYDVVDEYTGPPERKHQLNLFNIEIISNGY